MNSRTERALIRPAPLSRVATAGGAVVTVILIVGVSSGMTGATFIWFPCAMAVLCGFLWNAVRNQGAWMFDRGMSLAAAVREEVVLEAVVGRAVIPLADILEVHIDEDMTTIGVKTPTHYVVQSIATPASLSVGRHARERTARLFENHNIPCVWHEGIGDVYAIDKAISPFMWPGAVVGTFTRPLVWGSAFGGLAFGLLALSANFS